MKQILKTKFPTADRVQLSDAIAFVQLADRLFGKASGRRAWELVGMPDVASKKVSANQTPRHDVCVIDLWWQECMVRGFIRENLQWSEWISSRDITLSLNQFCRARDEPIEIDSRILGKELKRLCPSLVRKRSSRSGPYAQLRRWGYIFPDLSTLSGLRNRDASPLQNEVC